MASIPGGRADKLGNEFERLWTVRHLIELISGSALSVSIECLGDDEKGTEFWVERPDATARVHQCKRENGSDGLWSIADLANKNIISAAKFQLDRDLRHRFVFASGDKAPHLADLCECGEVARAPPNSAVMRSRHRSSLNANSKIFAVTSVSTPVFRPNSTESTISCAGLPPASPTNSTSVQRWRISPRGILPATRNTPLPP